MGKKYDLVHHPFYVARQEEAMLFKTQNGYELRFDSTVLSKRVYSSECAPGKNFIELEVTEDKIKVLSETSTLHEFVTPADFYVPMDEEARATYEELGNLLIGDNLEELCAMQGRFDANGFPECPVPRVTTASHYRGFTSKAETEHDDSAKCTSIRFGESIPTEAPSSMQRYVLYKVGETGYAVQDRFLSEFFKKNKIAKFKEIEEAFSKKLSRQEQEQLKPTYLKNCVALHAFYYSAGPWRHCWVALGYDPSTDRNNYKYQSVSLEGKGSPFRPVECPSVIEEVSRNMDWYVLQECDPSTGFISKALRSLLIYRLGKSGEDESESSQTAMPSSGNECPRNSGTP